jgi:hypothetical protein
MTFWPSVTNDRLTGSDRVESLRRGKRRRGVGFCQRGILDRRHGHPHDAARNGGSAAADVYLRRIVCVQHAIDLPAAREVEIPVLADPPLPLIRNGPLLRLMTDPWSPSTANPLAGPSALQMLGLDAKS